jgi:hypothetical protein
MRSMSSTEDVQEFIKLSLMTAHLDRARDAFAERVTDADHRDNPCCGV